ncbi:MAG TPA: hypothetical protein VK486_07620 [Thermoleophilaceae bacterium]|nr:hypothetical protein [Thermoleophilaceae bacterium]
MPDPTDEIQEILNFLLPYAERMLNQDGEFYPYAAALDADGELNAVATDVDDDSPDVTELLLALHQGLRERAAEGAIRASGIAADVTLTDPDSGETTDAVQVELDHAEADAVDIFVPYETEAEGIKFGDLVAAEGREPVFAHAAS